jgi:hypothetical protein
MDGALVDKKSFRSSGLRILICTLLLPFGAGAVLADPLPQPAQAAFDQKVVARLSAERAVEHIAYLSETIGPRPDGTESQWQSADYIASVLESYGYGVELQSFPVHYANLESVNVIAVKPANSGHPDVDAVLVTAHADTVAGSPGANDNASGVALTLELARVLRAYNTDRELRFVLFGSEERGRLGSRYYVDHLSDAQLDRIAGVFNADMVATSDPESTHLYAMTVDGLSNLVSDAAEAAGSRLGNSSLLPGKFRRSDHVSFHKVGIPAALFIRVRVDGSLENFYHTPQDTLVENISRERMQSALDIVGAAVFDLIRKEVPALENSRVRAGP